MNSLISLLLGYQRFKDSRFKSVQNRFKVLSSLGQRPSTLLISCCDSRAAPEVIFDTAPGELFVVRTIANIVPPFDPHVDQFHGITSAIEFGVLSLRHKHIVLLGHGNCGCVKAHIDGVDQASGSASLADWLSLLDPAAELLREERLITHPQHIHRLENSNKILADVTWSSDRNYLLADMCRAISDADLGIIYAESNPFTT